MEWLGVDRHRLGTAMLVFGLAGVVVAAVVAVALALGALAARDLDDRLAADQAKVAASLTRLSVTMESLATTTRDARTTLETSSETLAEARDVIATTSTTLVALSAALDISILGSRPFAGASEQVAELARTIAAFEGRTETLAVNLHQNAADASVMADHVRSIKTQLNELSARIAGFDRIGEMVALLIGGILLAALLTAWVGIAAGFCAWAGWVLRRHGAADRDAASGGLEPAGT